MSRRTISRNALVSAAAFIAMVIIFFATYDQWHNEQVTAEDVATRVVKYTPPAPVLPAVERVETSSATVDAEVTAAGEEALETDVTAEEKAVTFADAEAAFHGKLYDEAVEMFAAYTESNPGNPWGFYMLGLSAWKMEDYADAETALTKALELDPFHVKSHVNLARVLLDMNRPADALAQTDEALELDPASGEVYRQRGRAFYGLDRNAEAIDAYRNAIRIDDHDAWAMNNMALILIEEARYEEALRPLARAVELREDVAVFQNNLGMALEHTGHYRMAGEAYGAAVAIDDTYEKAAANRDRVVTVLEAPGTEPIDLAVIARDFAGEIGESGLAVVEAEQLQFIEPQTVMDAEDAATVVQPDSTGGGSEQ